MSYKAEFGIHNVDGTTVITGFGEHPVEVKPGERVTLTLDVNHTCGEVKEGILTADDVEHMRSQV